MTISMEVSQIPDSKWNSRLESSNLGTIYQTKEHGEYLEKINQKPIFLKFLNPKGEIISQLMISTSNRFNNKSKISKILKSIPSSKTRLYRWTYGPIFFDQENCEAVFDKLNEFLVSEKAKVSGSEHPLSINNLSTLKKNFKIIPWSSYLIDLSKPKDELFENIEKHSGRKNIERSRKRNVRIEQMNDETFGTYIDLLNKERSQSNIELADKSQMYHWWNSFKKIGLTGFIAKHDEQMLGGMLFSFFNNYIIEGLVVRTSEDYVNKFYSQDLIKWSIIEWGIEKKMKFYDLAGFNPSPTSKKEEGIARYKKKWGGIKYDYHLIRN